MGFDMEIAHIVEEKNCGESKEKRKIPAGANSNCDIKRIKLEIIPKEMFGEKETKPGGTQATVSKDHEIIEHRLHQSPKKRLQIDSKGSQTQTKKPPKPKFIYGNYNQYYGYRNKAKDFHDVRLDVFSKYASLFHSKELLDIGCNSGFITIEIAKKFGVKNIVGIDIDKGLINQANKSLVRLKKSVPRENNPNKYVTFPFNVGFVHGNYVLKDDVLLEMEREQFDIILCLSITKWIHLNFGDAGLKQSFKRMFLQLRKGGKLILEAQPINNYSRRKKMTETILNNYKAMEFLPDQFTEYLLGPEVGFKTVELMGVPEHCAAGFKRPIQIFSKE